MVSVHYSIITLLGAVALGITAVFLKKAHVDNIYYGLIIRAISSAPLVVVFAFVLKGNNLLRYLLDLKIIIFTILGVVALIFADMMIMSILRIKPVGIIAPLIAIFPLFTSLFLVIFGFINFQLIILGFTLMIVVGVGMVTYDQSIDDFGIKVSPFDSQAILYGVGIAFCLGVTNFFDAIILQGDSGIDGISYTGLKFSLLLVGSLVAYGLAGFDLSDWQKFVSNSRSTMYLIFAGITAWALGSILIYTGYQRGDAAVVNAIIGVNPVFAVLTSLALGMEKIDALKMFGISLCILASIGIVTV